MGQILIEMEKAGEIQSRGGNRGNRSTGSHSGIIAHDDIAKPKTIKDLDITLDQSSRYKALANAPEDGGRVSRPPCARECQQGARLLSNVMVRPCAREHKNLEKPEIAAATSLHARAGAPGGATDAYPSTLHPTHAREALVVGW